mgnify:CR=1 FL=1
MKLHIRLDQSHASHTRFTVFVNGANCGQLCMRTEHDVVHFLMILRHGLSDSLDSYIETGMLEGAPKSAEARA